VNVHFVWIRQRQSLVFRAWKFDPCTRAQWQPLFDGKGNGRKCHWQFVNACAKQMAEILKKLHQVLYLKSTLSAFRKPDHICLCLVVHLNLTSVLQHLLIVFTWLTDRCYWWSRPFAWPFGLRCRQVPVAGRQGRCGALRGAEPLRSLLQKQNQVFVLLAQTLQREPSSWSLPLPRPVPYLLQGCARWVSIEFPNPNPPLSLLLFLPWCIKHITYIIWT